ncbi:LysR family transcriptional regulator substrate-binding protein [Enterobacter sp. 22466]|uniref:LysR family transcriptional regulator substrate-binding protein n=1 Tax=Enterobacter sp. 22466 TaxID=3453924 RepID=UPI003F837594
MTLPEEPLKLAVAAELSTCSPVTLMNELPMAQYNVVPDNEHARRVLGWLKQTGVLPKVVRFPEMSQRLRLVQQGLAVSLVPLSVARIFQGGDVTLLDLPTDCPTLDRYVYCLQNKYPLLEDTLGLLSASVEHWLTPVAQH